MNLESLARRVYELYCARDVSRSRCRGPVPTWDQLPEPTRTRSSYDAGRRPPRETRIE